MEPNPSSSRSNVAYRGYPYLDPGVQDIPTISAEMAARWHHLPRRPAPGSAVKSGAEAGGSGLARAQSLDPDPSGGLTPKLDQEPNPVVYIDLPESSGSDVADARPVEDDQTYVQDTIFYDPFKDRRVGPSSISSGSSSTSSTLDRHRLPRRNPPTTLNLAQGASSSSALPSSLSKETDVYGQFGLLSEFQRNDFPEPPPAYTEIDVSSPTSPQTVGSIVTPMSPTSSGTLPRPSSTTPTELPRTQVIIPFETIELDSHPMPCHACGLLTNCKLVRESGFITHLIACFVLILALFPLILLVYCTNWFKYKNYYCRHCNKLVAFEAPITGQGLVYIK